MPQLDHYNFTFSFISFSVFFLFTIILIATVYLPMLHRHQKINELHHNELIAQNKITKKEALLLCEKTEQYILTELNSLREHSIQTTMISRGSNFNFSLNRRHFCTLSKKELAREKYDARALLYFKQIRAIFNFNGNQLSLLQVYFFEGKYAELDFAEYASRMPEDRIPEVDFIKRVLDAFTLNIPRATSKWGYNLDLFSRGLRLYIQEQLDNIDDDFDAPK